MSHRNTGRRKVAANRAKYTKEPRRIAEEAASHKGPELDWWREPEQGRFRAIVALFLLNTLEVPEELRLDDEGHRAVACSGVSRLLSSPIEISPHPDGLSILTDSQDHLVQSIAPTTRGGCGLPGLRAVEVEGEGESLLLRHLPTNGKLRLRYFCAGNPRRRKPPWFYPTNWNGVARQPVIDPDERAALETIPPMHEDAVSLLAGLVARLSCWSEQERWAVGYLVHDDLPGRDWDGGGTCSFVHLWGGDTEWVLRWGGHGSVPPADVARALTHEFIGITGATHVVKRSDRAEVHLGRARLILEHHKLSLSAYLDHLFRRDRHPGDEPVPAGEA